MKEDGREIERGMIEYDDDEERKVEGNKRDEISEIIGYDEREEMINRKDMVVREERDEKEEQGDRMLVKEDMKKDIEKVMEEVGRKEKEDEDNI